MPRKTPCLAREEKARPGRERRNLEGDLTAPSISRAKGDRHGVRGHLRACSDWTSVESSNDINCPRFQQDQSVQRELQGLVTR
ncbi:hypothetical protein CDAR_64861 [Caerostris darwini]|uniref:Uncharacterized protein n=1 Tax=Caerostris darwini TaxID=1538125 RepID=A0AAV4TNN8_9ARAC|nr:hypothetical protein CDAR_64861 [Caerostris darwini]